MQLKKMFLFLCILLFTSFSIQSSKIELLKVREVKEKKLDIDYEQVRLIESCNKDSIISSEGAIGAMQITPIVLKEWNKNHSIKYQNKDLLNRKINMKIGTWLLSEQIPLYFNQDSIPDKLTYKLIAYNWGIGNFKRWYKQGHHYYKLPDETRDYLVKYWDKY